MGKKSNVFIPYTLKTCFGAKKIRQKIKYYKITEKLSFSIVECFLDLYSLVIPNYDQTN